jgi:hypothetical protein
VAKIAAVTIVLDVLHDDGDKSRENTEATIYPLAAEASQRNASYILNPVFRSVNPQPVRRSQSTPCCACSEHPRCSAAEPQLDGTQAARP